MTSRYREWSTRLTQAEQLARKGDATAARALASKVLLEAKSTGAALQLAPWDARAAECVFVATRASLLLARFSGAVSAAAGDKS